MSFLLGTNFAIFVVTAVELSQKILFTHPKLHWDVCLSVYL